MNRTIYISLLFIKYTVLIMKVRPNIHLKTGISRLYIHNNILSLPMTNFTNNIYLYLKFREFTALVSLVQLLFLLSERLE